MDDNERDAMVLEQLRDVGSDLTQPHDLEFFLYFLSDQSARNAAAALIADGYGAEVHATPQPLLRRLIGKKRWTCFATKNVVPDRRVVFAMSDEMRALALRFNGEYDGWGCPVVR